MRTAASLGVGRVDGEHVSAAAALHGVGSLVLANKEEAAIGAQEGAEATRWRRARRH
jgi:hypothetical protein